MALLLVLTGCQTITGNFSQVLALEFVGPQHPQVEEGDTVRLHARALSMSGDSIPGAPIVWHIVELDTVKVGFTIDSTTGLVTGHVPGVWAVQASIETLRTGLISVTVTGAPDSLAALGATVDTVAAGTASAPPIEASVFDLTTSPGSALPLAGKDVRFDVTDPAPKSPAAATIALAASPADTVGADSLEAVAPSDVNGRAAAIVMRVGSGPQPDSVVVRAIALTALGDTVAGSPLRFVIYFQNAAAAATK